MSGVARKVTFLQSQVFKKSLGPFGFFASVFLFSKVLEAEYDAEHSDYKGKSALFGERKIPEGQDAWKY